MMKRWICFLLSLMLVVGLGTSDVFVAHASEGEPAPAPTVEITLDKDTVAVGETITATWTYADIPEDASLSAYWQVTDDSGNKVTKSVDPALQTSDYIPTSGTDGSFTIDLVQNGEHTTLDRKTFSVTGAVPVEKLKVNVTLDTSEGLAETPITATWSAQGGTPPYTYTYHWVYTDSEGGKHPTAQVVGTETTSSYTP